MNRVEIFLNASGSHRPLKKLNLRLQAFIGATHSRVGLYMYRNHHGCDGGRLYYDGCCCVVVKGEVVAQGSQFSLKDLEIVVAQVELERVASLRGSISCFLEQANGKPKVSLVAVPYNMCRPFNLKMLLSSLQKVMYHSPEEEIALGPDCWLWDYLSRSEAVDEAVLNGFQLLVFFTPADELEETWPAMPIFLAVAAVYQHLIQNGLRMSTSIVAHTAQCFSSHRFTCLIGYGANDICPYLACETCQQWRLSPKTVNLIRNGKMPTVTIEQVQTNFCKVIKSDFLKILYKMGISLLSSYCGAEVVRKMEQWVIENHSF